MEQEVNTSMDALTIIKTCQEFNVPKCSFADCSIPNLPNQRLTEKQLSPQIHSYSVRSEEEASYSKLQEFCLKNPIVIIHDLPKVLRINLSLFSTKALVGTNPNQSIELREQIKSEKSDENWNKTQNKKVWECVSYFNRSTIKQYVKYQTEALEIEKNEKNQEPMCSNALNFDESNWPEQMIKNNQIVKFATNVDLSTAQWKPQLKELTKLPLFLQVKCVDNMLSYMDHIVLGLNTVQLYMKVPGCRTTGHQENNNFCSVNINIGPGDCEWFAVPYEYWGVIYSLCKQNDIDYLRDSWWPPNLDVLHEKNVPVYRFYQKSGDVVWVNAGCIHWVHAVGQCNNIAWNVGPFTVRQYQLAMERYEWNKLQQFQSLVPMIHLSWKLAMESVKISNPQLFQLIKNCLMQTLKRNYCLIKFIRYKGVKKLDDEAFINNIYCRDCEVEIFNVFMCKKRKKNYKIYCLDCALKNSPSLKEFFYYKKHSTTYLMNIYDKFTCS